MRQIIFYMVYDVRPTCGWFNKLKKNEKRRTKEMSQGKAKRNSKHEMRVESIWPNAKQLLKHQEHPALHSQLTHDGLAFTVILYISIFSFLFLLNSLNLFHASLLSEVMTADEDVKYTTTILCDKYLIKEGRLFIANNCENNLNSI
jgi:hypothetical protein